VANQLNVLIYNIWATTILGSTKVDTRLDEMPAMMANYDVLVLTEVFDDIPTSELFENCGQNSRMLNILIRR
jgi:hypothetical protein